MYAIGSLVDVNRRLPAGIPGFREPLDTFLQREQVAKRIPAGQGHGSAIVARLPVFVGVC